MSPCSFCLIFPGGEIGKGIPVESPVSVNSPFSSHGRRGSESLPEESSPEVPISPSVAQTFPHSTNVTTPETHSGLDEEADETFRFIYSQEDQDNAEYLLKDLEEEVFNKVWRRDRVAIVSNWVTAFGKIIDFFPRRSLSLLHLKWGPFYYFHFHFSLECNVI